MIICIIDFILDPLKTHFYYISTGLMGSFSHGDMSLMGIFTEMFIFTQMFIKDQYSTAPKRGSVFIRLMTPDDAIWSRYQRTVLMR